MRVDAAQPAGSEIGSPALPAFRPRRLASLCSVFLATLMLGSGGYLGFLRATGNVHTVIEGQVYRSAQLSPGRIESLANTYGIKTIINLRGEGRGAPWYDGEIREAKKLGIRHIDFRMSDREVLSAEKASQLIALMRTAQKPVLIHCMGGADRSGLASALYLAAIAHADLSTSEAQLSFRYGHLSLPFIAAYAMDRTLKAYEASFGPARS